MTKGQNADESPDQAAKMDNDPRSHGVRGFTRGGCICFPNGSASSPVVWAATGDVHAHGAAVYVDAGSAEEVAEMIYSRLSRDATDFIAQMAFGSVYVVAFGVGLSSLPVGLILATIWLVGVFECSIFKGVERVNVAKCLLWSVLVLSKSVLLSSVTGLAFLALAASSVVQVLRHREKLSIMIGLTNIVSWLAPLSSLLWLFHQTSWSR